MPPLRPITHPYANISNSDTSDDVDNSVNAAFNMVLQENLYQRRHEEMERLRARLNSITVERDLLLMDNATLRKKVEELGGIITATRPDNTERKIEPEL